MARSSCFIVIFAINSRRVFALLLVKKKNKTYEKARFYHYHISGSDPEEAFHAINNPREWWSEDIEGSTDRLQSEFDYHNQDVHRCKIRIIELIPGQKVVWLVLDNYFNFIEDKSEWKGTRIIFDIAKKGTQTEIRFTHQGLVPDYECYDVCNEAWSYYINTSLRRLIATGKGGPNLRGGTGASTYPRPPRSQPHVPSMPGLSRRISSPIRHRHP